MISRNLLQRTISLILVVLFLVGCGGAATPISQQDSQKLIEEWELVQRVSADSIGWGADGNFKVTGDLQIDFAFEKHPKMTLVEDASQMYFKFDMSMPKGNSAATVIFATPDVKGATIKIPRFASTSTDSEDPKVTCFSGIQFHDYDGTYDFKICMATQGLNLLVVDMNVFYDGSEHHIYGQIELFGVQFTSSANEPLVFKIDGDKYIYVKGNGTATTSEGAQVEFGK